MQVTQRFAQLLTKNVGKVIVGKEKAVELMMIAVVAMLLVMIATRWAYISRTAKEAIRQRFVPPAEQADSLQAK